MILRSSQTAFVSEFHFFHLSSSIFILQSSIFINLLSISSSVPFSSFSHHLFQNCNRLFPFPLQIPQFYHSENSPSHPKDPRSIISMNLSSFPFPSGSFALKRNFPKTYSLLIVKGSAGHWPWRDNFSNFLIENFNYQTERNNHTKTKQNIDYVDH